MYSSASYLVDVYATDTEWAAGDASYVPEFVGYLGGTGNGSPVWTNNTNYFQWSFDSPQVG